MQEHQDIQWPALIHYDNDAELDYVENAQHWQQDFSRGGFEQGDVLIDCQGHVYSLPADQQGHVTPRATDQKLSLNDVLGLVKAHLADTGSCCVAKAYAPSIRDAIVMVIDTECQVGD